MPLKEDTICQGTGGGGNICRTCEYDKSRKHPENKFIDGSGEWIYENKEIEVMNNVSL